MIRGWPLVLALLAVPGAPRASAGDQLPATVPARPLGHVHDPVGWLPPDERRAFEERGAHLRHNDGIDLLVAVLATPPPEPPERYAALLASRWAHGDACGVVLHVAGDQDGPWLGIGGRLPRLAADPEVAAEMALARERVGAIEDPRRRLAAAAGALEGVLRFFAYRGRLEQQVLDNNRLAYQFDETQRDRQTLLTVAGSLAAAALAIGTAWVAADHWRRRRAPHRFPATSWRLRFGAPHAGGGDVLVRFDSGDPPAHSPAEKRAASPERSGGPQVG